jgi:DNA-binding transcriptional ArsR family regulator
MEKYIVVAPVGDFMEALYVGIREFPTERIILITPKELISEANKAKNDLEKFKIPVRIVQISGNIWEETFKAISDIKQMEKDNEIIINVATGNRDTRCAATSAAFVNGLKAFSVSGNDVMLLPVLKFSYYKLLTDKKMEILKVLYKKDCCSSMDELSKRVKMSLPLISYHINGNLKSDGLKEMGLVETKEVKGKVDIQLSVLGKLLIKGYIPYESEKEK